MLIYLSNADASKETFSRKRKLAEMESDFSVIQQEREKLTAKLEKCELSIQLSQDELQSAYADG